jgi:hypothetical protein
LTQDRQLYRIRDILIILGDLAVENNRGLNAVS